jgi:hypothetical protein
VALGGVFDLAENNCHAPRRSINVWECVAGNGAGGRGKRKPRRILVPVRLLRINYDAQVRRFQPVGVGLPCCNPDGSQVAIVEAVCSDRMIVAGPHG